MWQQQPGGRRRFSFNLSHPVYGEGGETLLKMNREREISLFFTLLHELGPSGESVTGAIPLLVTPRQRREGRRRLAVQSLSCCWLRAALGFGLLSLMCFCVLGVFCLFEFVWRFGLVFFFSWKGK